MALKVITPDSLKAKGKDSSLLDDLQSDLKANSAEEAIKLAVEELGKHFKGKGAALPFDYEPSTGFFQAKDVEFLRFVKEMSGIRSSGRRSRDFECRVAERLQARATGTIHRVGHPRENVVPFIGIFLLASKVAPGVNRKSGMISLVSGILTLPP